MLILERRQNNGFTQAYRKTDKERSGTTIKKFSKEQKIF